MHLRFNLPIFVFILPRHSDSKRTAKPYAIYSQHNCSGYSLFLAIFFCIVCRIESSVECLTSCFPWHVQSVHTASTCWFVIYFNLLEERSGIPQLVTVIGDTFIWTYVSMLGRLIVDLGRWMGYQREMCICSFISETIHYKVPAVEFIYSFIKQSAHT